MNVHGGLLGKCDESIKELEGHFSNMCANGGTMTHLAINDASVSLEKYGREEAEKVMIVLTDGVPSKYKETIVAYQNAEEKGIRMLTILFNIDTRCCIFPELGYYEPTPLYEIIKNFIGAGEIYRANGEDIIDALGVQALRFVQHTEIGTKTVIKKITKAVKQIVTKTIQESAQDDEVRRNEVKNNCKDIDNTKGTELKKLEDMYDSSKEYEWIDNNTKMIASGKVVIDQPDINNDNLEYTMDLVLKEREKVNVTVEKNVKSIRVKLGDGSTLIYKDVEHPENNIGKIMVTPNEMNPTQYVAIMDDELLHGATIEITYKITVKDQGEPLNGTYVIYDYIDEELSYKQENNETNNWKIEPSVFEDKLVISREFSKDNATAELTLTRVLATNSTDEYENYIEIVKYSNNLGRRIYETIPKNLDAEGLYNNTPNWYIHEVDDAQSQSVNIIPPFGLKKLSLFETISICRMNFLKWNGVK